MTIQDYCTEAHKNAVEKGFYDFERGFAERMMLIVCEAAEAVEADRKGLTAEKYPLTKESNWFDTIDQAAYSFYIKDTVESEIADIFIRLFDLCGSYNIDIESFIKAKMRYNKTRQKMHGKRY